MIILTAKQKQLLVDILRAAEKRTQDAIPISQALKDMTAVVYQGAPLPPYTKELDDIGTLISWARQKTT